MSESRIPLVEDEAVKLVEMSDYAHPVQFGLGTGALVVHEDNSRNWAMYVVAVWRGVPFSETDKYYASEIVRLWSKGAQQGQPAPAELVAAVGEGVPS
jgi:hypothetical protein